MKTLGMFHQANGGHGHGGPLETSAVAAFFPDLIHAGKAQDLPEPPDLSGLAPYFLQKSTATNLARLVWTSERGVRGKGKKTL
jgi:creatinine amidohydrolase/Fe(II)-dependent formamide hydrolase-like protein